MKSELVTLPKTELDAIIARMNSLISDVHTLSIGYTQTQSSAKVTQSVPKANITVPTRHNHSYAGKSTIPTYGDFHTFVGAQNDNPTLRVARAKAPKGLFSQVFIDGSRQFIILNLPDGTHVELNCDSEARSHVPTRVLDAMNVGPNTYIVFTEIEPGIFDISVDKSYGVQTTTPKATKAVKVPKVDPLSEFDEQPVKTDWQTLLSQIPIHQKSDAVPAGYKVVDADGQPMLVKIEVPKQRTAAQLANDAKLRELAKARKGQKRGTAKVDTTPIYVPVNPTNRQVRIEADRKVNRIMNKRLRGIGY